MATPTPNSKSILAILTDALIDNGDGTLTLDLSGSIEGTRATIPKDIKSMLRKLVVVDSPGRLSVTTDGAQVFLASLSETLAAALAAGNITTPTSHALIDHTGITGVGGGGGGPELVQTVTLSVAGPAVELDLIDSTSPYWFARFSNMRIDGGEVSGSEPQLQLRRSDDLLITAAQYRFRGSFGFTLADTVYHAISVSGGTAFLPGDDQIIDRNQGAGEGGFIDVWLVEPGTAGRQTQIRWEAGWNKATNSWLWATGAGILQTTGPMKAIRLTNVDGFDFASGLVGRLYKTP